MPWSDPTLSELGEISKTLLGGSAKRIAQARARDATKAMRDRTRQVNMDRGVGDVHDNFGLAHSRHLDGSVPFSTRVKWNKAAGGAGEAFTAGVGREVDAAGKTIGEGFGTTANEVSRNASRGARTVGYSILGGGAVGGAAFGAASNARKRKEKTRQLVMDERTKRIVLR